MLLVPLNSSHEGTDVEVQYMLMTFGIPCRVLPVTPTGELKLESHLEWLEKRREMESKHDSVERILVPGPYDVLVGRGRFIQDHSGNLRYRNYIEDYMERYEQAKKRIEKTDLTSEIVRLVKESSGRFLRQDGCGWVEVDDDAARDKVSHSFRNRRKVVGGSKPPKPSVAERGKAKSPIAGFVDGWDQVVKSKRARRIIPDWTGSDI